MNYTEAAGLGFSAIIDAAPVGVLICWAEDHILYVNLPLASIFGYPESALTQDPTEIRR